MSICLLLNVLLSLLYQRHLPSSLYFDLFVFILVALFVICIFTSSSTPARPPSCHLHHLLIVRIFTSSFSSSSLSSCLNPLRVVVFIFLLHHLPCLCFVMRVVSLSLCVGGTSIFFMPHRPRGRCVPFVEHPC